MLGCVKVRFKNQDAEHVQSTFQDASEVELGRHTHVLGFRRQDDPGRGKLWCLHFLDSVQPHHSFGRQAYITFPTLYMCLNGLPVFEVDSNAESLVCTSSFLSLVLFPSLSWSRTLVEKQLLIQVKSYI